MLNAIHSLVRRLSNLKLKGHRRRLSRGGLATQVENLEGRQLLSATTFSWTYSPAETTQNIAPAEVSLATSTSNPDVATGWRTFDPEIDKIDLSGFHTLPARYAGPSDLRMSPKLDEIKASEVQRMYRVFNTGADFTIFSTDKNEYDTLKSWGLQDQTEGRPGFEVLKTASHGAQPIHRLYNPNNSQHYFTMNDGERDSLVHAGWHAEPDMGNAFSKNAARPETTEVYMLYKTKGGDHLFTTDAREVKKLLDGPGGWVQQTSLGYAFGTSTQSSDEGNTLNIDRANGSEIIGTLHLVGGEGNSGAEQAVVVTVRGVDILLDLHGDQSLMTQANQFNNHAVWLGGNLQATQTNGTELSQVTFRTGSLLALGEQPLIRFHTMMGFISQPDDPIERWLDTNFPTQYDTNGATSTQAHVTTSTATTTSNGVVTTSHSARGITGAGTANKSATDGSTISQGQAGPFNDRYPPEQPPVIWTPFGKPGENWETTKKIYEGYEKTKELKDAIEKARKGKVQLPSAKDILIDHLFPDHTGDEYDDNPERAASDPTEQQRMNDWKLQQQNQKDLEKIREEDEFWRAYDREIEQMLRGDFQNQTPCFPSQSQPRTPSNGQHVSRIGADENRTGNEPPVSPDLIASGYRSSTDNGSDWQAFSDQLLGSQMPGGSGVSGGCDDDVVLLIPDGSQMPGGSGVSEGDAPGSVAFGQMSSNNGNSDWTQIIDQLFGDSSSLDQLLNGNSNPSVPAVDFFSIFNGMSSQANGSNGSNGATLGANENLPYGTPSVSPNDPLVTGGFGGFGSDFFASLFGQSTTTVPTGPWGTSGGNTNPFGGFSGFGDASGTSIGFAAPSWGGSGTNYPGATSNSVFNGLGDGSNTTYAGWPNFNNANDLGTFYTAAAQQHTFTPTGYNYL